MGLFDGLFGMTKDQEENLRKASAFHTHLMALSGTSLKKITDDDLDVLIQYHRSRAMQYGPEGAQSQYTYVQIYQLEQIRRLLAGTEKR